MPKPKAKPMSLKEENETLRAALKILLDNKKPPPSAAPIPEPDRERPARDEWDPKWKTTIWLCPKCKKHKFVNDDFGVRMVRGVERTQPYCRKCRNSTNYYGVPRKNRSRNNP